MTEKSVKANITEKIEMLKMTWMEIRNGTQD